MDLPVKETKKFKTGKNRLKSEDWKPSIPNFCPCKDPDTDEKCGNYLRTSWDISFYEQYGMCEKCFIKYNNHLNELGVDVNERTDELKKIGEKV